jgi:hypothetical protein
MRAYGGMELFFPWRGEVVTAPKYFYELTFKHLRPFSLIENCVFLIINFGALPHNKYWWHFPEFTCVNSTKIWNVDLLHPHPRTFGFSFFRYNRQVLLLEVAAVTCGMSLFIEHRRICTGSATCIKSKELTAFFFFFFFYLSYGRVSEHESKRRVGGVYG